VGRGCFPEALREGRGNSWDGKVGEYKKGRKRRKQTQQVQGRRTEFAVTEGGKDGKKNPAVGKRKKRVLSFKERDWVQEKSRKNKLKPSLGKKETGCRLCPVKM